MSGKGAPLRFALAMLGLWLGWRGWWLLTEHARQAPAAQATPAFASPTSQTSDERAPAALMIENSRPMPQAMATRSSKGLGGAHGLSRRALSKAPALPISIPGTPDHTAIASQKADAAGPRGIKGSGWLLIRQGGGTGLAAGGLIGGSQAGARIELPLSIALAATMRVSTALEQPYAPEAAIGATLYPLHGLGLTIERRLALGDGGRNAFAAFVAGGIWRPGLPGGLILDGYGQAGIVGARRHDLFADGLLRLAKPIDNPNGPRLGLGLWGAAQPGAARLELGPSLALPLHISQQRLLILLDGRLRIAGAAEPGSGIALSLAGDF